MGKMFPTHMRNVLVVLCVGILASVQGHGRLMDPPSRSSMWRMGFKTPENYNDNQLFCGGMTHQWNKMNGKCGICGDPYDGVRENEAGGLYATGTIGKYYKEGQIIRTAVEITANHLGWFEFRLCVNNDVNKKATQECLDKHLLQLADGSGARLYISSEKGFFNVSLRLPAGVTCKQCVLQWKYHTGNTWGEDKAKHCSGLGCTEPQEEFYGCADVAIQSENAAIAYGHFTRRHYHTTARYHRTTARHYRTTARHHRTTARHHHRTTPRTRFCRATGIWIGHFSQDRWCRVNCAIGNCPRSKCRCD